MTREYPIKTSARTGVLTVTEHADRVEAHLHFDQQGARDDELEIVSQLQPFLSRFDRDDRPLLVIGADTGIRAAIDVDDFGVPFALLIEEPRR